MRFYYRNQKLDEFAALRRKQQLKKRRLQTQEKSSRQYLGARGGAPAQGRRMSDDGAEFAIVCGYQCTCPALAGCRLRCHIAFSAHTCITPIRPQVIAVCHVRLPLFLSARLSVDVFMHRRRHRGQGRRGCRGEGRRAAAAAAAQQPAPCTRAGDAGVPCHTREWYDHLLTPAVVAMDSYPAGPLCGICCASGRQMHCGTCFSR